MPLILALRRLRQKNGCKFKANLSCIVQDQFELQSETCPKKTRINIF